MAVGFVSLAGSGSGWGGEQGKFSFSNLVRWENREWYGSTTDFKFTNRITFNMANCRYSSLHKPYARGDE